MKYRVKWVLVEKNEGFVDDGDQDGDAWEGSKKEAEKFARELRKENPGYAYKVVPTL